MNPCLLIPIYDHKDPIGGVVASLAGHGLRCFIVDDGSDEATQEVLRALEAANSWVRIYRRKHNGGRGAALKTGYRLAAQSGFSHAIQLDADGQHDAADVPRFLEEIERDPSALVLGVKHEQSRAHSDKEVRTTVGGIIGTAGSSRSADCIPQL